MGKPIFEKESNFKRAKMLLEKLDKFNTYEHAIKDNDLAKITKITKYTEKHKAITPKQYRALTHYSKVYDIKVLQSIDFLLD